MQMTHYRAKKSSRAGATYSLPDKASSQLQVERPKRRAAKAPPSRFNVEPIAQRKRTRVQDTTSHTITVESEFGRYAFGNVSPDSCDALQFWEVCQNQLNGATLVTHPLNRPTSLNSQRCTQSPWTTSQSRERLCRVSAFSRLQRRPTPQGETDSARK